LASAPDLCSKSANKENRELKRLVCCVNYDTNGGHSNRVRGNGRGLNCSQDAKLESIFRDVVRLWGGLVLFGVERSFWRDIVNVG